MHNDNISEGQYQEWCGMGEMADYYAEQEVIAEATCDTHGQRDYDISHFTRESIWTCKDRTGIAVKDMDDKHLLNTIRMLQGNSPIGTTYKTSAIMRRQFLLVMCNEAYRRGLELL